VYSSFLQGDKWQYLQVGINTKPKTLSRETMVYIPKRFIIVPFHIYCGATREAQWVGLSFFFSEPPLQCFEAIRWLLSKNKNKATINSKRIFAASSTLSGTKLLPFFLYCPWHIL
jgi:hypothetical protein